MAFGTGIMKSFRNNQSMLRSGGMQNLKFRTKINGLGTMAASHFYPITTNHDEKRMQQAAAKGIRKEVISYLRIIGLLSLAALIIYVSFVA